jgi:hypothetical protein
MSGIRNPINFNVAAIWLRLLFWAVWESVQGWRSKLADGAQTSRTMIKARDDANHDRGENCHGGDGPEWENHGGGGTQGEHRLVITDKQLNIRKDGVRSD